MKYGEELQLLQKVEKQEQEIAALKDLADRATRAGEKLSAELAERKQRSDVWMKSDYQCREYANGLALENAKLREALEDLRDDIEIPDDIRIWAQHVVGRKV